jgi:hypothetical protein
MVSLSKNRVEIQLSYSKKNLISRVLCGNVSITTPRKSYVITSFQTVAVICHDVTSMLFRYVDSMQPCRII